MNYGPPLPVSLHIAHLNARIEQLDANIERLERIEHQLAVDLGDLPELEQIDDSSDDETESEYEFEYLVDSDDDETIVNYTEHDYDSDDDSDTETIVDKWNDPYGTPDFLRRRA